MNLSHLKEKQESADCHSFEVDWESSGQRLDLFLVQALEDISRSAVQKCIREGLVFLDGRLERTRSRLIKSGERVDICLPRPAPKQLLGEALELDVRYEDEDLLVLFKPAGLVVHPGVGNESGTLVNGLLYRYGQQTLPGDPGRAGIVHRLDKDTSGLLMVAKTQEAYDSLTAQLKARSVERGYDALVFFGFKEETGCIDAPLGRDPKNRLKQAVVQGGREAITRYRVEERLTFRGAYSRLSVQLETGRTHQIRAHLAHIHHPVVGDLLYGPRKQPFQTEGQLLHSGRLALDHPRGGERLTFSAPWPEAFQAALERLRRGC